MRYVIKDSEGAYRAGTGLHPFKAKHAALDFLHELREGPEGLTFKLYRLVSKREKLKRKLLTESDAHEGYAKNHEPLCVRGSEWHLGYARALRYVASQL